MTRSSIALALLTSALAGSSTALVSNAADATPTRTSATAAPRGGDIVAPPPARQKGLGVSGPGALHPGRWEEMNARVTRSAVRDGLIPDLKPLIPNTQLRDTVVMIGGDGNYYLTGSSGSDIWDHNDGVELWRSPDLKQWTCLGLVWTFEKDATWEKHWRWHNKPVRALWAPELHYIKRLKNYFITLSMPPGNRGLLRSTSGKPEGPYVNALAGDAHFATDIDASLFEDDDGTVYFVYGGGWIARMKDDLSGLAEEPRKPVLLHPDMDPRHHAATCPPRRNCSDIGHEGAYLFKKDGKYYLTAADTYEGRYSSLVAISDNIYGPYDRRHEAVPTGGGTNYFKDKTGDWWCAYFGNDDQAPFREKPAIVRVEFDAAGLIHVAKEQPDFVLQTPPEPNPPPVPVTATSANIAPGLENASYHGRFSELPVGAVQPRGWIKSWLQRQADGLTGHPENLSYPYDTCMFAGKIPPPPVKHGETWWPYEQSGYFVDGIVRLNRLIDSPNARRLAESNLNYILDNSGATKLGESTWGWPNAVVGRALMAEHSVTGEPKLTQVLTEYLTGPNRRISRDGFVFEEELYVYGQTGDARLLENVRRTYDRLFMSDPRSFSHIEKLRGPAPLREHGVTAAEQLKLLPLMYCYTGDAQALELANLAYRKIEADSLMPDGGMVSSENLGPTVFDSLHESCDITDWSWSIGYLFMAGGEAHWADLIEQTTFNALPGAVTKDFKQLQYFSSPNQILASNTARPRIAPTRMSYRAAHDTECCSGNINRAMPNYVTRMWMKMDGGVAATLYGPSELSTSVNGQPVTVTEETDYPFRSAISFRIKLAKSTTFALALRIPEWCATATATVNGVTAGVACAPGAFATIKREFRDGDSVVVNLPMTVRLNPWFDGRAASVQRGPLVYSLAVAEERREHREDPEPIRRALKGNDIAGFPAVEFFPTGEWRYGIDASVSAAPARLRVVESAMTDNPFLAATTPVRIEIPVRSLPQWGAVWQPNSDPANPDLKAAPKNPATLPDDTVLRTAGPVQIVTLVPYGSTHLRLTTFPLIATLAP